MTSRGFLLVCALTCGCNKGSGPPAEPTDLVFQGSADAPALDALVAIPADPSAADAPIIDSPPSDTILPANPPPRFAWHLPAAAPPASVEAGALSGAGYYLVFSDDDTSQLFRVFTTETSYTPDASAWATISAAGTWTALTVDVATFADDRIAPDGGPFVGTPILFCVGQP